MAAERIAENSAFRASRTLLYAFVLLMIFEGAVRKWVEPSLGTPLQVARDLMPTLSFLALIMSRPNASLVKRSVPTDPVMASLIAYFVVAVGTALISGQDSLAIPALGIRTHFAYAPLALLIPMLFGREKLDRCLWAVALLGIPIFALSAYQSTQPFNSWINVYGDEEAPSAMFGDNSLVRATGTFSYITGMSYFAQYVAGISFYLATTAVNSRRSAAAYVCLAAAIVGCFATGTRAALFGAGLQICMMLLLSPPLRKRLLRRGLSTIASVIIVCLGTYVVGSAQIDAFMQRTQQVSSDVEWRLTDVLTEWTEPLTAHPLGSGVGSGHQKAATFLGEQGGFGGYNSLPESELSRVAIELGIIGFLAFGLFRISCYVYGYLVVTHAREGASALAALSLSTMLLLVGGGVYSPMANAMFWASLGMLQMVRSESQ